MSIFKEYKKDVLLFIEAAYIAINQTDEDSAIKMFKAVEILDKTNPLTKIGYGYLALHKLELSKAEAAFREVLKKEPNNAMAKTFLGIALSLSPKDMLKGEKILAETVKSHNKDVKNLAGTALEFVDKFLKKSPTPVEGKKRNKK